MVVGDWDLGDETRRYIRGPYATAKNNNQTSESCGRARKVFSPRFARVCQRVGVGVDTSHSAGEMKQGATPGHSTRMSS